MIFVESSATVGGARPAEPERDSSEGNEGSEQLGRDGGDDTRARNDEDR